MAIISWVSSLLDRLFTCVMLGVVYAVIAPVSYTITTSWFIIETGVRFLFWEACGATTMRRRIKWIDSDSTQRRSDDDDRKDDQRSSLICLFCLESAGPRAANDRSEVVGVVAWTRCSCKIRAHPVCLDEWHKCFERLGRSSQCPICRR
ncbi:MAG: hypothetical protein EBX37_13955 [Alphaproteobacteria bacterium]|nr:hypothetical protein [Alphaproteobacteria bacterium]